jgi:hypothetical protein
LAELRSYENGAAAELTSEKLPEAVVGLRRNASPGPVLM